MQVAKNPIKIKTDDIVHGVEESYEILNKIIDASSSEVSGDNLPHVGYMYRYGGFNHITLVLSENHAMTYNCNTLRVSTGNLESLNYMYSHNVEQSNITSLTFRLYSIDAQFKTGTIFKVYKK